MSFVNVFLVSLSVWEIFRIIPVTGICSSILNPDGDFYRAVLILLLNSGALLVPLCAYTVMSDKKASGTARMLLLFAKSWMVFCEGIILVLFSRAGDILLRVLELFTGSNAVFGMFSSGVTARLPFSRFLLLFFVDLLFLLALLLYKPGTRESNGREGGSRCAQTLPEAEVVRIDEEDT